MAIIRTGRNHRAKKDLFQKGLQRGYLTIQEIETSLPSGALTAAERWLLYYSLRAAEVEIRDELGAAVSAPPSEEELRALAEEQHPEPRDGPSQSEADSREQSEEGLNPLDPAPSHQA
jgi:hypothetical protein